MSSVIGSPIGEDILTMTDHTVPAVKVRPMMGCLEGGFEFRGAGVLNGIEPSADTKGVFVWISLGTWIRHISGERILQAIGKDFCMRGLHSPSTAVAQENKSYGCYEERFSHGCSAIKSECFDIY
jgi:hypothetical protein